MTIGVAVSNMAWDPADDAAVAAILRDEGCTGVELVPSKQWSDPAAASSSEIRDYRRAWEDRGLRIASLQSLLFARPDLMLFGDERMRRDLLDYLRAILDVGAELGARAVVFGSPKNRSRGALPVESAQAIATDFFRELGAHASARGVLFCVEPVSPVYGCDFLTTPAEALELVHHVSSPGVRVNADVGSLTTSAEDSATWLRDHIDLVGHVHASEPDLGEVHASPAHEGAARGLADARYDGWVSVEMSARALAPGLDPIRRAAKFAKACYG